MSEVDETLTKVDPPSASTDGGGRRSIKIDPLQFEALTTFARLDFWCFVELMFPVLYPGQELVYAGYLELIATLLMGVAKRAYRNVVINLPPRHMKSALASVLYPAWRLGCDPTVKFICISYGDDLAHDLSAQTRKIMRSSLYKLIFPRTILDKSAVDHIRTTMGGYRYATAVGSDITGFGADEIIIDDPVQPEDALSERVKQQLRDWVNSSVYTRFNDPSKGALVLVMHRLAPDDLAGTIEPSADFVLKLPLIAEKVEHYTYQDRTIMRREPGEPLNPSRLSVAEIEALKARIAPHVFASQYQQRPEAGGTGYCSIERLARYAEAPPFELIVHSWDIASTKGGGDWTVCAKFGLAKELDGRDILYLIGIVRMQVELPDVREAIIAHDSHDKPAIIVMDGNGIGRGPYQDLWARGFRHLLPGESHGKLGLRQPQDPPLQRGSVQPLRRLGAPPECDAGARARNLARRNRCLSRWEARRSGRRPELRRGVPCEGHPRGPSLGPQARTVQAAAGQGSVRPAQVARSGTLRTATMASGLTGARRNDDQEKILPVLATSPWRRLRSARHVEMRT